MYKYEELNNLDEHLKKLEIIPKDIKTKYGEILKLKEELKTIMALENDNSKSDPFSFLGKQNEKNILNKKETILKNEIENLKEELNNLPSEIITKICPNIDDFICDQKSVILDLENKISVLNTLNKSILLTGLVMIGLTLYKHFY
uniref:Uncharacterized protein n=1 Tax=viral metagenome TaxID=1070528 RepID=A0A6C0L286_9ZZZZ|tara:strand:- start:5239 stop:5673 length:435 start_codon:yes stop_codon:yes gene_type:complete